MKRLMIALAVAVFSFGVGMGDAEAKRLGGGQSSGMQRNVSPAPASAPSQAAAAKPGAPAAAPAAAQPKRNWMGPLAGLAAGLGIAALLSHFGLGEGMGDFLMILLLAGAAFVVIRMLLRKKAAPAPEPMQYAGVGGPGMAPPPVTDLPGGSSAATANSTAAAMGAATTARPIPADFDAEGFVRIAKLNFVRLQAANDTRNLDDLREFLTPELFAEVQLQITERGPAPQQTDVVTLNAELLEVVSEGGRHIASVRFHGMLREEANAPAAAFDEVWNLVKPLDGQRGWMVAGIQQLQ